MLLELSTCCELLLQATTTNPIKSNLSTSVDAVADFDIDWPLNSQLKPFLNLLETHVEPTDVKLLVGVLREKSTQLQVTYVFIF